MPIRHTSAKPLFYSSISKDILLSALFTALSSIIADFNFITSPKLFYHNKGCNVNNKNGTKNAPLIYFRNSLFP